MGTVRRVVCAALMLVACREAPVDRPTPPPDDAGSVDAAIERCGIETSRERCEVEVTLHAPGIARELAADAGVTPRLEPEAAILIDPHASRAVVLRIGADASPRELRTMSGEETGGWSSAAAVVDAGRARSFVLFYDPIRGGGRFVRFEWSTPDREPTTTVVLDDVAIAAGWDQVVPVACTNDGCQRFVLHDVDSQTATTLDFVWLEGSVTVLQRDIATLDVVLKHVWRSAWNRGGRSRLTGVGSDGGIASLEVDVESGRFVRAHDGVAITKGGATDASVDLACPIAEHDGVVRSFLARASGRARLVRLHESFDAVESDVDLGPLDPYSHAVTLPNGVTFFYRSVDGSHAFARLEPHASTLDLRRGTLPLPEGIAHVTAFARATP